MSNKSQINQLSKREILEGLLSRQQQDNATVNRLVIALAMLSGQSPEALAKSFADSAGTADFAAQFNKALDDEFSKKSTTPSVAPEQESVQAE